VAKQKEKEKKNKVEIMFQAYILGCETPCRLWTVL